MCFLETYVLPVTLDVLCLVLVLVVAWSCCCVFPCFRVFVFNSAHALETHFAQCQHFKPPFQLPPCPQNTFQPVPTPELPISTAAMLSKQISHSSNTSNLLFNCPNDSTDAPKTHFTQRKHLKPPFEMPPFPQSAFHTVRTPDTPFPTASMPSKHIPSSANTSNPLSDCLHDQETYFKQCEHFKPPFLPPMPSKQI